MSGVGCRGVGFFFHHDPSKRNTSLLSGSPGPFPLASVSFWAKLCAQIHWKVRNIINLNVRPLAVDLAMAEVSWR